MIKGIEIPNTPYCIGDLIEINNNKHKILGYVKYNDIFIIADTESKNKGRLSDFSKLTNLECKYYKDSKNWGIHKPSEIKPYFKVGNKIEIKSWDKLLKRNPYIPDVENLSNMELTIKKVKIINGKWCVKVDRVTTPLQIGWCKPCKN